MSLVEGSPGALSKRGISHDTCARMSYWTGNHNGRTVQIANYFGEDGTEIVAQKLRYPDKSFEFVGNPKLAGLFGHQLWRSGGKRVIITEGEIDALSVSQALQNKWPVVSIPNGAQGAAKALAKSLQWLNTYDQVILCFDNDEHGAKAVQDCVKLFPPGKVAIVSLPLKDASDMLQANRTPELITRLWEAKEYRPDGIVSIEDVEDRVLQDIDRGLPWFLTDIDDLTFGRRLGEVIGLGAGTGIGKSDFLAEQVAFDLNALNQSVGVFFLEQTPAETVKRLAGKLASQRFHVPDGTWTKDDLGKAVKLLKERGKLYLYDNFGATDWDVIRERIRFLAHSEGVKLFYLDHLTALAAAADDERVELERIMAEIAGLAKELDVWIMFVSHLATPDGRSHEEGGRVTIRQFKGSRAIGFWSHFMFGMERDQQSEDEDIRGTTIFRCLKDRLTGQSAGKTVPLAYNPTTGRISVAESTGDMEPML